MKRFLRQLSAALLCCAMLFGSVSALGLSQSQIDALDAKGVYVYEVTPAAADTFNDTSDETVLKAYAAGIINGVGDGKTFAPDDTTNREQIALMLYRAAQYVKNNGGKAIPDMGTDISKYTDRDSVSLWAKEAVGALANNGVMKGSSDTTLSPAASCSKEQSIILVYRLYEVVK